MTEYSGYKLPDGMTPEQFLDKITKGKVVISVFDIDTASTVRITKHITHDRIISLGHPEAFKVFYRVIKEVPQQQCLLVLTLDSKFQFNGIAVVQISERYYSPTIIKFFDLVVKMNGLMAVGVIYKPDTIVERDGMQADDMLPDMDSDVDKIDEQVVDEDEDKKKKRKLSVKQGELLFITQLMDIGQTLQIPVLDVLIANKKGYLSVSDKIHAKIQKNRTKYNPDMN